MAPPAATAANADGASDEDKAKLVALEDAYNGAATAEEGIAADWSKALKAFKAANPQ